MSWPGKRPSSKPSGTSQRSKQNIHHCINSSRVIVSPKMSLSSVNKWPLGYRALKGDLEVIPRDKENVDPGGINYTHILRSRSITLRQLSCEASQWQAVVLEILILSLHISMHGTSYAAIFALSLERYYETKKFLLDKTLHGLEKQELNALYSLL